MKINELITDFGETSLDFEVSALKLNSQDIKPNDVFVALAGKQQHGLDYADEALKRGAKAIIYAPEERGEFLATRLKNCNLIRVDQLAFKLAKIAAKFHNYPAKKLDIIGITGTNGKTTCSQFLSQSFDNSSVIGTLGWGNWKHLNPTINTTPEPLELQRILAELVKKNHHEVFMEVSSHGLEQGRVEGIDFKGAVFTNLSRDHLDYHHTIEAYFQAKLILFKSWKLKYAIINLDDAYSHRIINALSSQVKLWTYSSIDTSATVYAQNVKLIHQGLCFEVTYNGEKKRVSCTVYGNFNVDNILATIATLLAQKVSFTDACEKASKLKAIAGRMQAFGNQNTPQIFVDYAHTPDALEKALLALKQHKPQRLFVVFGCGGERDEGKREQMGRIATEYADSVFITDDNPRRESAGSIVRSVLKGCDESKAIVVRDRKKAIKRAILEASKNDYILIAGKGHEDYQEINEIKYPFSDQAVVEQFLQIKDGA